MMEIIHFSAEKVLLPRLHEQTTERKTKTARVKCNSLRCAYFIRCGYVLHNTHVIVAAIINVSLASGTLTEWRMGYDVA